MQKKMQDQYVWILPKLGANSGIGFETALELARRGATVVLASRNQQKVYNVLWINAANLITLLIQNDECRRTISAATGNLRVHALNLDLSSQGDVRRFVRTFRARFSQLHYLINNAGCGGSGKGDFEHVFNEDGHESVMATNFLGMLSQWQTPPCTFHSTMCLRYFGKDTVNQRTAFTGGQHPKTWSD